MESYDKIKKVLALGFMNFLDENRPKEKMCLSNGECADIEKAFSEQDWSKLDRYLCKYAESEDEKVRKELIFFLKEEIPQCSIKEHADKLKGFVAYLEKQKEQKPAEWSEDYREEDIQTRFAFYTYKDDPSVLYLSNVFVEEASRNHGFGTRILKAAEKAAEAIGAITICLKVKQGSPANAWYRKRGYGYVAFEDGYDWLEKNLEYLKPVKQEWSEEDEQFLLICKNALYKYQRTDQWDANIISKWLEERLKSLRPSWKPSEEDLEIIPLMIAILKQNYRPDSMFGRSGKVAIQRDFLIARLESLYDHINNL